MSLKIEQIEFILKEMMQFNPLAPYTREDKKKRRIYNEIEQELRFQMADLLALKARRMRLKSARLAEKKMAI